MDKFIISIKDKKTGRDVIAPYLVGSLDGFGHYCEKVVSCGFVIVIDCLEERDNYVELGPSCNKEKGNCVEFKPIFKNEA